MKTLLLAVSFLLLATPARASYTDEDKVSALALMAVIDLAQSLELFQIGSPELNPVLGDKPSAGEMLAFGAVGVAAVYGVAKWMPEGRFKRVALDSILATQRLNIEENENVLDHGRRRQGVMLVVSWQM